jgi:hypothetical protein
VRDAAEALPHAWRSNRRPGWKKRQNRRQVRRRLAAEPSKPRRLSRIDSPAALATTRLNCFLHSGHLKNDSWDERRPKRSGSTHVMHAAVAGLVWAMLRHTDQSRTRQRSMAGVHRLYTGVATLRQAKSGQCPAWSVGLSFLHL